MKIFLISITDSIIYLTSKYRSIVLLFIPSDYNTKIFNYLTDYVSNYLGLEYASELYGFKLIIKPLESLIVFFFLNSICEQFFRTFTI